MDIEKPQSKCGQYTIERTLGKGYHAKVKLAKDPNNRLVAIKIFKNNHALAQNIKALANEIQVMKQLNHPNLVQLYDYQEAMPYQVLLNNNKKKNGQKESKVCIVLEIAQGGELFEYVAQTGRFREEVARFYFKQLIDGLKYMTDRNFSHRDIKPENLLFDSEFNLKIADFGFAAALDKHGIRQLKSVLGTPGYMAPEIQGKQIYDGEKVDLFAAAVVLFIMFAGSPPFSQALPNDPYYKLIINGKNEQFWNFHAKHKGNPNFFSQDFKDMMNGLLAPQPEQRFNHVQLAACNWLKGPTATIQQIQEEFRKRRTTVDGEIERERAKKQAEKSRQPTGNLQSGVGRFRSGVHLGKYEQVLSRIDPLFKITTAKRIIKQLPKEELENQFFSIVDKDELLTFLLDYTSTVHKKGEYEQEYQIINVQDAKYKFEFSKKSDEYAEPLQMQVELIESGDLVSVTFMKNSGDALFYQQSVLEIQDYVKDLVLDQIAA